MKSGSRHIAVLADMKELGERYLEYHYEVGQYAASSGLDVVVTLGEACKKLAEGVRAESDIPVMEFMDKEKMMTYLEEMIQEGDCLLFKGSNSMGLSQVVEYFIKK